jgi:hypothetical protein
MLIRYSLPLQDIPHDLTCIPSRKDSLEMLSKVVEILEESREYFEHPKVVACSIHRLL